MDREQPVTGDGFWLAVFIVVGINVVLQLIKAVVQWTDMAMYPVVP